MYMLDKRINKFEIYGQYKHDDTLLCNCRVSIVAFETIFGIILTIKIIYKQVKITVQKITFIYMAPSHYLA